MFLLFPYFIIEIEGAYGKKTFVNLREIKIKCQAKVAKGLRISRNQHFHVTGNLEKNSLAPLFAEVEKARLKAKRMRTVMSVSINIVVQALPKGLPISGLFSKRRSKSSANRLREKVTYLKASNV